MSSLSVERSHRFVTSTVTWVDDLTLEWGDPAGVARVSAVLDFAAADVRIILRRGANERTLAPKLGERMSYSGEHMLATGDEVVLQVRALVPSRQAISEVAELAIEAVV